MKTLISSITTFQGTQGEGISLKKRKLDSRDKKVDSMIPNNSQLTRNDEKTIICHSFPAWDTPYIKSTVELMSRLSGSHRVIFVDYHYTWKDVLTNPHAPKKRLLGFKSRWRKVQTKFGAIEVYSSPPIIPTNWINNTGLYRFISGLNGLMLRYYIRKVVRRIGHRKFTLINAFNPIFGCLTQKAWKASKSFYYCYDEISGTEWAAKHGPHFEKAFAAEVDGVICTSPELKLQKSRLNPNCHVVSNGVNLDIFKPTPPKKAKNTTMGYIGAIDGRIDFALLKAVAEHFQEYQIDLYGPVKTSIPDLPDNVSFHGPVPQESLPSKIEQMDICLIPFVKNELTKAIYPLKINEYLAMGKPVVSTDFADLSDFDKLIGIGSDTPSFINALKKALRYNSRLKAQKRMAFAQENSWEKRSECFASIIS